MGHDSGEDLPWQLRDVIKLSKFATLQKLGNISIRDFEFLMHPSYVDPTYTERHGDPNSPEYWRLYATMEKCGNSNK